MRRSPNLRRQGNAGPTDFLPDEVMRRWVILLDTRPEINPHARPYVFIESSKGRGRCIIRERFSLSHFAEIFAITGQIYTILLSALVYFSVGEARVYDLAGVRDI